MSVGYHDNSTSIQLVSGTVSADSDEKVNKDDRWVWGSVTKVMTGSSVLRLVESGAISLNDSIVPLIDPFITKTMPSLVSLENLFGPEIKNVTVEDLLGMKSGVPDFDTAKPGLHPSDSFRA
jgi:CubicO group peptidase (beta-lactamase class C family)